jgi:hypothetical protein
VQKPVVEPPQVQNRLQLGGYGSGSSARPGEICLDDSKGGELCRYGGHGESLRRTHGDAAGEKLGASSAERSAVNVGTTLGLPYILAIQAGNGQARRQLIALGWGGVLVVVRAWESHVHGEGEQRVRSYGTGIFGGH